jgi:hypothetical protein
MGHSLETVQRIWDDKTGDRLEIGPDDDSLDMTEIRQYDTKNVVVGRMVFTDEQLPLVIEALHRVHDEKETDKKLASFKAFTSEEEVAQRDRE